MQDAIQISPAPILTRPASPPTARAPQLHASPSLIYVLDRTMAVFARYPVPMLACAFLCFGMPVLVGVLVYAGLNFSVFSRNGNFFTAASAIYGAQLQIQAILGTIMFLLGRGAIAWMVLQTHAGNAIVPLSLRTALSQARQHWRSLLLGTLLHGVLISIAMAGLVLLLRELRLDVSSYRYLRADANSVFTTSLVRVIAQMPPDPGAPFTELYAAARYQLSRQGSSYNAWSNLRDLSPRTWAFGVAGALALILLETLLCGRNAAIMQSREAGLGSSGWLLQTLAFSRQHFWKILAWRWGVRIMLAVLLGIFLTLPMVLHQSVFVTALIREARAYWPYALYTALYALVTALIGMLVFAFHTAFDAQLYATLRRSA